MANFLSEAFFPIIWLTHFGKWVFLHLFVDIFNCLRGLIEFIGITWDFIDVFIYIFGVLLEWDSLSNRDNHFKYSFRHLTQLIIIVRTGDHMNNNSYWNLINNHRQYLWCSHTRSSFWSSNTLNKRVSISSWSKSS